MVLVDEDSDSSLSSILSDLADKGDLELQNLLTAQTISRKRNSEDLLGISKVKRKAQVLETTVVEENTIITVNSPNSANEARKKAAQPRSRAEKTKAQFAVSGSSPRKKKSKIVKEAVEEQNFTSVKVETVEVSQTQAQKSRTHTKTQNIKSELVEDAEDLAKNLIATKGKRENKPKQGTQPAGSESPHPASTDETTPKKTRRKRKTKEEKEAEAMPLAARSNNLRMFIGAHVSCAKGVHNAVTNALHIGGNAFACFLKSQRKWDNPPLQDEHRDQFRALCTEHSYDAASYVVPHGSYLVNLAQEDPTRAKQAYDAFLDDLRRCEALGIKYYNFHPGFVGTSPLPSALTRIAHALNAAHTATSTVVPLLENMAGSTSQIGSTFSSLSSIISQVTEKSRIGVCLDTCHTFAAGYDLRSPSAFSATLQEFDSVIGLQHLKALHLNDSKAPLGSHRDLHANIGTGFLGLRTFWNVMNEKRFEGLPMVLETPIERKGDEGKMVEDKGVWAREIKLLEGLIGMDIEGEEFRRLEEGLAREGEGERERVAEQVKRKMEKERKKSDKGKGRRRRKGEGSGEDSE